jgi:hypothetical protein
MVIAHLVVTSVIVRHVVILATGLRARISETAHLAAILVIGLHGRTSVIVRHLARTLATGLRARISETARHAETLVTGPHAAILGIVRQEKNSVTGHLARTLAIGRHAVILATSQVDSAIVPAARERVVRERVGRALAASVARAPVAAGVRQGLRAANRVAGIDPPCGLLAVV